VPGRTPPRRVMSKAHRCTDWRTQRISSTCSRRRCGHQTGTWPGTPTGRSCGRLPRSRSSTNCSIPSRPTTALTRSASMRAASPMARTWLITSPVATPGGSPPSLRWPDRCSARTTGHARRAGRWPSWTFTVSMTRRCRTGATPWRMDTAFRCRLYRPGWPGGPCLTAAPRPGPPPRHQTECGSGPGRDAPARHRSSPTRHTAGTPGQPRWADIRRRRSCGSFFRPTVKGYSLITAPGRAWSERGAMAVT
jgi:hypothetical protein